MSTAKLLTAVEAEAISRSKDPAFAVETILGLVRKAAERGDRTLKTYEFGFGDSAVHRQEAEWPELNLCIVKGLRELGYDAEVRVEYRQFADIWLQVSWGPKATGAAA
jgi:hypothetical protein